MPDRNRIVRVGTEPSKGYNEEVREIERKIRACKRRLER